MTPEDRDFKDRADKVLAWPEPPTAPDDVWFLVETLGLAVERVRDRLLPEHSISLDDADRDDLERVLAGLVEGFDQFWLQSLG
jgi:hypothetical protein